VQLGNCWFAIKRKEFISEGKTNNVKLARYIKKTGFNNACSDLFWEKASDGNATQEESSRARRMKKEILGGME